MGHLEKGLEWVRPLILGSNSWDYCVVWKLSDDPSRFIEFVGCCCGGGSRGGGGESGGIKQEKAEQHMTIPLCRDAYFVHPANTDACEALSKLPSSMPLYSGIHGEVAVSSQPRWLDIADGSNSNTIHQESSETQVLIPVTGGLVELFAAKHVPKNQLIIKFVVSQFNLALETETMTISSHKSANVTLNHQSFNSFIDRNVVSLPQLLFPITHQYRYPNFDGSSTGSIPSDEYPSPDSDLCSGSHNVPLNPNLVIYPVSKRLKCDRYYSEQNVKYDTGRGSHVGVENEVDGSKRMNREHGRSKNLYTERNRRNRIKDRLYALRALVPKITKMDNAAILGDAIDYIGELKEKMKQLQGELKALTGEHTENGLDVLGGSTDSTPRCNGLSSCANGDLKIKTRVEVNKLGSRMFLLKITCQRKRGAITRFMESLSSLGLQVTDVSVTTCNGVVLSILIVQTNKEDIEAKEVEDSLMKLAA